MSEVRLIDANALIASVDGNPFITESVKSYVRVSVKAMPTVDAVKHGEWIPFQRPNGGYYKGCSVCSSPIPTDSMLDYMDEIDNRFCYNCGAKMDGEEQDDG